MSGHGAAGAAQADRSPRAAAVTGLAADPRPAGVGALSGQPAGIVRLRVGDYHVVYVIDDERIRVLVGRAPPGRVPGLMRVRVDDIARVASCDLRVADSTGFLPSDPTHTARGF
jgi:hypothetical protein